MKAIHLTSTIIILLFFVLTGTAQEKIPLRKQIDSLQNIVNDYQHRLDILEKQVDDNQWFLRLSNYAFVDKVYICGPPAANAKNSKAVGANNPVKFYSYVFIPKGIDMQKKYPLIVLPHGGVHADFTTYHMHIIKELLAQRYIVVAPEYRGSTGYGKAFWELIDYGGLEVEDVDASREYMIENYDFVDSSRVGIVGWSHGGLIALFCLYNHPDKYKVGFAGVPVSNLIMRLNYQGKEYADLYSAPYHIGKTVKQDSMEYKRRSPSFNTDRFTNVPLLIHTNTNDDDVHVSEVKNLIQALQKNGKKFQYEIFQDFPGGHSFDRIDGKENKEIRLKVWTFINTYLNPPIKLETVRDMNKAAYYPPH